MLVLSCVYDLEPLYMLVMFTKGYIVSSGLRRSNGVQGLRVVVQSDRDVEYVEKRTEAFLLRMQVLTNTHFILEGDTLSPSNCLTNIINVPVTTSWSFPLS